MFVYSARTRCTLHVRQCPVKFMAAKLGVGIVGIGWVAVEHLRAFLNNPRVAVVALCTRDEGRARERLQRAGVPVSGARFVRRYADLLAATDVDVISIATPNHLHAAQAVAAARAGKHILLEKPTGLDLRELRAIRDAVRRAGVRTIVSFELHYNPYLRFAKWLREAGWLGRSGSRASSTCRASPTGTRGWSWVRTKKSGRSHLLAAGCHAVDALRWCTGLEVDRGFRLPYAFHGGYEWPTSIVVNLKLAAVGRAVARRSGSSTSSTDFQMPYAFGVEMMGDRATLRDDLILWNDVTVDLTRFGRPVRSAMSRLHERPHADRRAGHPHRNRDAGFART